MLMEVRTVISRGWGEQLLERFVFEALVEFFWGETVCNQTCILPLLSWVCQQCDAFIYVSCRCLFPKSFLSNPER